MCISERKQINGEEKKLFPHGSTFFGDYSSIRWVIKYIEMYSWLPLCPDSSQSHQTSLSGSVDLYLSRRRSGYCLFTSVPFCLWTKDARWGAELLQKEIHRPGHHWKLGGRYDPQQNVEPRRNKQCKNSLQEISLFSLFPII